MTSITSLEVKKQLTMLFERVARGESFVITKYGRPVATLLPPGNDPKTVEPIIQEICELRRKNNLGKRYSIRRLIASGRRIMNVICAETKHGKQEEPRAIRPRCFGHTQLAFRG